MFGILNINKPSGMTSRDAVNRVMRCLPRKTKLGHAGTLDPIAHGVLLVCVGPATRLIPYIHQYAKTYRATFQLGQHSETDDIEGELIAVPIPDSVTSETIAELLPAFTGLIDQVPPKFSAVKVNGKRAYDVARQGQDFELDPKQVVIHRLEAHYESPILQLDVECGTGTYIRSLGRDIAEQLGTAAVMTDLIRTAIGPFNQSNFIELNDLTKENVSGKLQSPVGILNHYPRFHASADQIKHLRNGRFIDAPSTLLNGLSKENPLVILDDQQQLIALGIERDGQLAPSLVFPAS